MDGTTSFPLLLGFSTPPSCACCLPFSSFPPTQSFTFFRNQSLHLEVPLLCFFMGFSSVSLSRWWPHHPLVLNGGFQTSQWSEERPFLPSPQSLHPPACPLLTCCFLLYLPFPSCQLSVQYQPYHTPAASVHIYFRIQCNVT